MTKGTLGSGEDVGVHSGTSTIEDDARELAVMTRKIAHDMNNLITGIFGHAELAAMTENLSDEVRENLDGVIDAATRASHLATQLLVLGRRVTAEPADIDLGGSIEIARQVIRNQFPSNIELVLQLPPKKVFIHADPSEVHQAIVNLCENARDAIGNIDGKISISLGVLAIDDNELAAPRSDGWCPQAGEFAALKVQDSGKGIHINALSRLFEPFFSTKGSIGTGLGLTIVQRLVQALGGFVEVKTLTGSGSIFTVFLPTSSRG